MANNQTTRLNCPYGFNGTQEQLLKALRHHPARESASSRHVKDTAAWFLEQKDVENDRLIALVNDLRARLSDVEGVMVDV